MVRCTYNMYATEYNNHVEYNNTASAVYDMVIVLCCVHVVCAPNHCVKIKI